MQTFLGFLPAGQVSRIGLRRVRQWILVYFFPFVTRPSGGVPRVRRSGGALSDPARHEVLREELDALGLSANALSKALGVPVNQVTMILNGQRGVSVDTALRLARYVGTTPQLWLNSQKTWELRRAEIETGREIAERVTPRQSAA